MNPEDRDAVAFTEDTGDSVAFSVTLGAWLMSIALLGLAAGLVIGRASSKKVEAIEKEGGR